MAPDMGGQDIQVLDKFTRFLTLKVAQVVVQSRLGKKIVLGTVPEHEEVQISNNKGLSPSQVHHKAIDWFNLAIPDIAEVTKDTKKVLNGEIVAALSKVFVVEISLQTDDGDEMILELWTIRINPESDPNMISLSTVYYRMGIILKSTLTISRIAPAYKIARSQANDSYKISYRIYPGPPNTEVLGEGYKTIRISELCVLFGTIQISLLYRTVMTLTPSKKQNTTNNNIMVQSNHFPNEPPKKSSNDKRVREIDLNKPLTPGAFVDPEQIRELRESLSRQLPTPPPQVARMFADKLKLENARMKKRSTSESVSIDRPPLRSDVTASSSAPTAVPVVAAMAGATAGPGTAPDTARAHLAPSRAVEVPRTKRRLNSDSGNYSRMMDFPFADGSPITELATFYQQCLDAKAASEQWEPLPQPDPEEFSETLKQLEDAVPEFDNIALMFNSDSSTSQ